jgi:hypothetical protein
MASGYSRPYFAIIPILLNVIAIVVLAGVYVYMTNHYILTAYATYLYWTVNVLISYNILVSSVRSIVLPLIALAAGGLGVYGYTYAGATIPALSFLSFAQCWQLAILGVIGLLICFTIRLQ